jgi:SAM-dependent methyltransferase
MVQLHPRTQLYRAKNRAKAVLNAWPSGKSLAYVVDDVGWGVRQRLGRIESDSGSTHRTVAIEDSVTYVEEVFHDYRTYGGLDHIGGTAAEVGPGDNAGVALLLQWAGCQTVDLVDRFRSRRNPDQQKLIYQALAHRHQPDSLPGNWDDERLPGITWRLGSSAEDFFARYAQEGQPGYDLIVSRATLEHLYDPLDAIRSMAACLKHGGRMVHKVDFRDHGMFTPAHPELTFLRFPAVLYREMTRRSGRPNRVLLHRYRDLAEDLGRSGRLEVTILVTSLVGQGEVTPHVPFAALPSGPLRRAVAEVESQHHRFAREFANVAPEDLAVSGIFWIGTRPGLCPDVAFLCQVVYLVI